MRRPPVLGELPPGFALQCSAAGVLAVRSDVAPLLELFGFGLDGDGPLGASGAEGRRPLAALDAGEQRFLVRRFSHGGLARWLTGRRFLDPARPFRELVLSEALRARGIPTPEVVAARARPAPGAGWRLDLVTRRVPDAMDLGVVLARARRGELAPRALRAALAAAGAAVRALHEAGLEHADLNPNNLLLGAAAPGGGEPRLWVLDLDRSRLHPRLSPELRHRSLARLFRHVARRERRHGAALSRADHVRFLRAYAGPGWKEEWASVRAHHARWRWLHGLGGELERRFGRTHDPREAGA